MSNSKTVMISDAEFKRFRELCGNGTNWTDGGHWMGMGKEPNCALKQTFRKVSKITVRWPTEESANRWNDDWEQAKRNMGYVGTGLLTIGIFYANVGKRVFAAVAVNVAFDIIKGELLAKLPYPKAKAGWSMETKLEFSYQRSAHPWGKDSLRVVKTIIMIDDKGIPHIYSGPETVVMRGNQDLDILANKLFGNPGSNISYDY